MLSPLDSRMSNDAAITPLQPQQFTYRDGLTVDWFPAARASAPLVAFCHGGGWRNGSPAQFHPQAKALVAQGISAASIRYRLIGAGAESVWDCLTDVADAISWLRQQAATLGWDGQRFAISGGSAGGHLALMSTLLVPVGQPLPQHIFAFNPVCDCGSDSKWANAFAGRVPDGSPLHQVRSGLPPLTIFQGDHDQTTSIEGAEALLDAWRRAGNRGTLHRFAGCGHGFFNKEPYLQETTDLLIQELTAAGWTSASTS
jgi:acetyl esterase